MKCTNKDMKIYFDNVKQMISEGASYLEVSSQYPLATKALYKKLGGVIRVQRFNNTDQSNVIIMGDPKYAPQEPNKVPDDLIRGTVLGDSTIEIITDSKYTQTALLRYSHCWQQISYCKALYELLKPLSSAVTIKPTSEINKDYVIQTTTISTRSLFPYYKLFYKEISNGIYKKYPFNLTIIEGMTPRSLAFWLMDDGNKYGSGPGAFEITISKQPHYGYAKASTFVRRLSDRLGVPMVCREEKNCYCVCTSSKDKSIVESVVAPYVLPYFSYKLGFSYEMCGDYYRDFDWFQRWETDKISIEHPYILKHPYKKTYFTMNESQKKKYLRCLYSRVRVRGFPYNTSNNEDLNTLWYFLKEAFVKDVSGKLTASPRANRLSSHFFRHRYSCHQKNRLSPESVFYSNKHLKKVLKLQLKSGPDISNTNIRNAICTYGTTALGQFNSAIVRYLTDRYCVGENVLDPCSGWGNRLAGVIAAGRNYYGIEPCHKTYEGLCSFRSWLLKNVSDNIISISKGVAEKKCYYPKELMDFAITSPPYFDIEVYDNHNSQSALSYRTYDKWLECFLNPMIYNTYNSLRDNTVFALNIGDSRQYDFVDQSKKAMLYVGFVIEGVFTLKSIKRPGMKKYYSEVIIIGRKNAKV